MNQEQSLTESRPAAVEETHTRPIYTPPVDIFESAAELLFVADLPGVNADALDIHYESGALTLEGVRKRDDLEIAYRRVFSLPKDVDAEKITAELKHGVLTVKIPKAAAVQPRQIGIKAV
jgi:HSP20 family protein